VISLPEHIRRLRIVTVEQAALVMAGLSTEVDTVSEARDGNYKGWREAEIYKETLFQSIKLKEIKPIRVLVWASAIYELPVDAMIEIDTNDLSLKSPLASAEFLAADIWAWVEKELSVESSEIVKNDETARWGEFRGKETALKFIAGMAIALEKAGGRYQRGGKLNKSAVATAAIKAMNEHGNGFKITEKALTDLIDEAFSQYLNKPEN